MILIRKHYERYLQFYDILLPVVSTVVLVIVIEKIWGERQIIQLLNGSRQVLYITLASICSSLLGFIVTTVSIILVIIQLPGLNVVRKSSHFTTISDIYFRAICALALSTIWSIVAAILDRDQSPRLWAAYLELIIVTLSIRLVQRCIWILKRMVREANRGSTLPTHIK